MITNWINFIANILCGVVGCVLGALATNCSLQMINMILGYSVSIILIVAVAFIFNRWIEKIGTKILNKSDK